MGLSEHDQIIVDHEKAQTYGTKYLSRMQKALFDRGQYLTLAMDGFNEFVKLPKGDSKAAAIWDLAFNILATAVPMLRIAKFIDDQYKGATLAYEIAKAVGDKATKAKVVAKVAGGLQKAGKVAEKINNAKETVGKITEPAGKVLADDAAEEAKSELTKRLDSARTVIKGLVEDGNKAIQAWEKALDAEIKTFENQLSGAEKRGKTTLEAYIQDLLKPPPELSVTELDQVESKYLWLMIGEYCRKNVTIVTTTNTTYIHSAISVRTQVGSPETSIEGLNDTQKKTLVEWFGANTRRGKIFTEAPVATAYDFLRAVKVPEVKKSKSSTYFTPSAKM